MTYGIIVDSSCDFYDYKFQNSEMHFERVPLKIEFGDEELVDDRNLSVIHLMDRLDAYKGKSGTAAPAPGEWLDEFEKYDVIFAITITGGLSGSVKSAYAAKDMLLEHQKDKEIYIIDSLSTGPEVALLIRKLEELITEGLTNDEIMKRLSAYQKRTHLVFQLGHLDNLIKNGRISKAQGIMAGLLGISIIGRASEKGELEIDDKIRGKKKSLEKLMHNIQKFGYIGGRILISHCLNPDVAEDLKKKVLELYPEADIDVMEAGGLCSFYMQRGGLCVGFEG